MKKLAKTPQPPYYAVIFANVQSDNLADYAVTASRMAELAEQQPGFLGMDSCRDEIGITVSYWRDTDSIRRWKQQADHCRAQQQGREQWYQSYSLRIAKVERAYDFTML